MHETSDALGDAMSRWAQWPTVRQRTAVRQAVSRLLDDLAPETPAPRGAARVAPDVQRIRSRRGCILQGLATAVTVSWFPAADTDADFGELQVIAWRGTVSHPGAPQRAGVAAVSGQALALHPVETADGVWKWQAADATAYDASALAERCLALLDAA